MRLTSTETLSTSVHSSHFQPQAWAQYFCSLTMRMIKCSLSLDYKKCLKVNGFECEKGREKEKELLFNGKLNHFTCLLLQIHYLLNFSLLLTLGLLLLCALLSTEPSFFSKHIITFMGIARVQFMFLLAWSGLSGTDYKNNAFILLGEDAALMSWF